MPEYPSVGGDFHQPCTASRSRASRLVPSAAVTARTSPPRPAPGLLVMARCISMYIWNLCGRIAPWLTDVLFLGGLSESRVAGHVGGTVNLLRFWAGSHWPR